MEDIEIYTQKTKNYLNLNGYTFDVEIESQISVLKIYELFYNNNFTAPLTHVECFYYAIYFDTKRDDANAMIFYKQAIDLGNRDAIYHLGYLYYRKHDYENAIKSLIKIENSNTDAMIVLAKIYKIKNKIDLYIDYLTKAVEKGSIDAMLNLAGYYHEINKPSKRLKYLKLASQSGHVGATKTIGDYYKSVRKYKKMVKYYKKGASQKDVECMKDLAFYYEGNGDDENMKKYYIRAIKHGCSESLSHIISYCNLPGSEKPDLLSEVYILTEKYIYFQNQIRGIIHEGKIISPKQIDYIIQYGHHFNDSCDPVLKLLYNALKTNIDIIDLHYRYQYKGGDGYEQAKSDFIKQVSGVKEMKKKKHK